MAWNKAGNIQGPPGPAGDDHVFVGPDAPANGEEIWVDTDDTTGSGGWKRWLGTQAEYDALTAKDPFTLYAVVG
jgi:hypothetical protein